MSILFSHFLSKNNEISPQETVFTEVLCSIALKPKTLYFYGKIPEKSVSLGVKSATSTEVNSGGVDYDNLQEVNQNPQNAENVVKITTKAVKSGKMMSAEAQKSLERPKTVAIVGTRKPTDYGANIARKLAYECAKRGAVVVSGLAYGIDSIAHRGALEAGGITVGVLGTPIDQIYPRSHYGLAEEIVRTGGCIMSELAPGAEFYPKTSFLERNRIISGLADVVVIVEAAERSGSLNTAAHALEQGKDVFAVPADITRPMSQGCNKLIKQGATPYLGPEDVLDLLFPPVKKRRRAVQTELLLGDTPAETAILQALGRGLASGEEILAATGLEAAVFNQNMTMLEIKGCVVALGMNKWALK